MLCDGLQPVVTKCIGMAARKKAPVMLPFSMRDCHWRLRNAIATQKVVFDQSRTLALCGSAAGRCKKHCAGCCDAKNWVAEATEGVAWRQLKAEVDSPDKRKN